MLDRACKWGEERRVTLVSPSPMSLTNTLEGALPLSIYSVLKGEHNEVAAMIKTLKASPIGQEALMKKLRQELLSHAEAEQITVYSKAEQRIANKNVVQEAKQEHEQMKQQLMSVESLELGGDSWKQKLQELENSITHHVKEEETQLFEEMKKVFNDEEAKEIAKEFHEAKKREMERSA